MANPVYHVTFTKNVADIQKRGLDPLSQSLWEKAETGERYQQDPSVYGFSDPKEALNWATKMAWEFEASPSDISILTLEGGDHWQKDPSGDLNLGQSAQQSLRLVEPSEVLDVFSLPEPVGTNAEFQEAVPGGDFEDWKDFYSKRLGSRPPDQSNLPAAIDAAAEASRLALPPDDEPRPKGKGQMFRGIGSLMRGRILPLVRAAQMGYELLPEDKQVAGKVLDYLQNTPTHEFFGMDKPGIEYFKDLLGISKPGSEGGIITLPESLYQDLYHGTPNVWDPEWVDDVYYPEGRPRSDSEVRLTGEGFAAITGGFYAGEASGTGYSYADILAREHGTVPNVYKGEIRKDILNNQFIDYNLPVNEQPLKVQEVFKDLAYETKTPGKLAGADILFRMRRELGEDVVEDELRKRGIVGVRFLDQLSRNDQNLYQGKSLVKKDGKALSLNQDWERDGRNVLKYLVDNKMDVAEFVREQRQVYRDKGKISRFLGNAKQWEKFLDILEGTTVKKTPLTRNMVIWDQTLLNQIGKTIKKELAHGGFVVKPLYDS